MSFREVLRTVNVILSSISIFIVLVILVLDVLIMQFTFSKASIALPEFNKQISYTGIMYATIGLEVLFLIFLIVMLIFTVNQLDFVFYAAINLVLTALIALPHEAIVLKFYTCFSFNNLIMIYARIALSFLLAILILVFNINYFIISKDIYYRESTKEIVIKILVSIGFLVVLAMFVVLNALMIVNLNPVLKNDISPSNIYAGFFSEKEIDQVRNGTFNSSVPRNLTALSNIIDATYVEMENTKCKGQNQTCKNYFLHQYDLNIDCTSDNQNIYTDCKDDAKKITLRFLYSDQGEYPIYNCAVKKENSCTAQCPDFLSKYKIYLVQYDNSTTQLGWKGLCNCETKQPRVMLSHDKNIDLCKSNSIRIMFNLSLFSCIFLLYFNLYSKE